jgi:cysteine-S-conjugate beta-lyase
MKYDFDTLINRAGTYSLKWEFIQEEENLLQWRHTDRCFGEDRTLPMWVADMDLVCPRPVVEALVARAAHGIYGYTVATDSYYAAVVGWMRRRQGWEIAPEWVLTTPGVVPALNMLVGAFVRPGEKVLIQPPVYYPFYSVVEQNGSELVVNPLLYEEGRYRMDYDGLEAAVRDPQVTMAILCSPHNPVGRVWTRDELVRFGEICFANDVLVVSDEIHGDLMLNGLPFTPFASIGGEFARRSVVCTAPSKTFNLAGLHVSNIIISECDLRVRFVQALSAHGLFGIGAFGVVAAQTAYEQGEEWLDQALDYIAGNLAALEEYIAHHIPEITVIPPEGTYLVWLDCRRLGLDKMALRHLMLEEARVYLDEGFIFGPEGEGFERINIACPRSLLMEALQRIERAVHGNGMPS